MKSDRETSLARDVGAAIARKRGELGLTQDQVSEALGIGPEAVSRIERGVVLPSLPRLVELAELFQCSVEYFLGKNTGLVDDSARIISEKLKKLSREDRRFVLDLVELSFMHLERNA
ncbi:transcriptional regulator [Paracidovorax avenae]|uniref:helix-turn-helix domain-containing protein n=1 Tax=Paracidovorax avenae TaxID=80867 RepID=UPI000D15B81D|nr:helix-turn-helix transcriptional regulator [Paracidovorax avenae]AVS80249.1 transcriptional regulator [Paracidovorax avenae]AVT15372.1 transcriptional regulator [Paracidovorax avenae]